jgi:hypothetical protein
LRNTSSLFKSSLDHLLNSVLTCDRFQISGCHLIDNRPVGGFSAPRYPVQTFVPSRDAG